MGPAAQRRGNGTRKVYCQGVSVREEWVDNVFEDFTDFLVQVQLQSSAKRKILYGGILIYLKIY